MAKLIARIVSVLLHPLIMPVYGLLVIFQTNGDVMLQIPFQAKRVLLAVVAINTLVLPILVLPVFRKMNIIKSLQMESHRERILPILFTLIPYIFSFYFLMRLPILSEISLFMLGATLAVLAALVISIWWKISIHMIGIGGLVGLTLALTYNIQYSELPYLILYTTRVAFRCTPCARRSTTAPTRPTPPSAASASRCGSTRVTSSVAAVSPR